MPLKFWNLFTLGSGDIAGALSDANARRRSRLARRGRGRTEIKMAARASHAALTFQGALLIFGGEQEKSADNDDIVSVHRNNVWTTLPCVGAPPMAHVASASPESSVHESTWDTRTHLHQECMFG